MVTKENGVIFRKDSDLLSLAFMQLALLKIPIYFFFLILIFWMRQKDKTPDKLW